MSRWSGHGWRSPARLHQHTKHYGNIATGTPRAVASNACGVGIKSRFSTSIRLHRIVCCQRYNRQSVTHTAASDGDNLVTLIAGKQRRLLFAGNGRRSVYVMTKSLKITPKTTEQNLIIRTGKSEATITDNKRLGWRYCTVEANYWQTQRIAPPLCDSRATCGLYSK